MCGKTGNHQPYQLATQTYHISKLWQSPKIIFKSQFKSSQIIGDIIIQQLIYINNETVFLSMWMDINDHNNIWITKYHLTLQQHYHTQCMGHPHILRDISKSHYKSMLYDVNNIILIPIKSMSNHKHKDNIYLLNVNQCQLYKKEVSFSHYTFSLKTIPNVLINDKKTITCVDSHGIIKLMTSKYYQHHYLSLQTCITVKLNQHQFNIFQNYNNVSIFSLFGQTMLIMIHHRFKSSLCIFSEDSDLKTMIPLITPQVDIEKRIKQSEIYKIFISKFDHVFILFNEITNDHCLRTTIACLNGLNSQWTILQYNLNPQLIQAFLNHTQSITSYTHNGDVFFIGNWLINKKSFETIYMLQLDVWSLLPETYQKEIEHQRVMLNNGFIRQLQNESNLNIPLAIIVLCIKYYDHFKFLLYIL